MPETTNDTTTHAAQEAFNKKPEASMLRGSLKLETSASTPVVSAGSEFSIYVVIRNPFSVPVTIFATETHIPVELSDQNWRKSRRLKILQNRISEQTNARSVYQKILRRFEWWLSDISEAFSPDSGPRVAIAITPDAQENISRPESVVYIEGNVDIRDGDFYGTRWQFDFSNRTTEEINQILFKVNEFMLGRSPIVLHAGDSTVKHFILKTTQWLTFTPISYTFQIQVRYEIESEMHVDTVPFALNIRAAIGSSLIGSVIGSILGALVSSQTDFSNWIILGRSLLISIIFALIVVVAFARKSNVQQIVSVEDFWGGIFVGFLVGYSGGSFVDSVLALPG